MVKKELRKLTYVFFRRLDDVKKDSSLKDNSSLVAYAVKCVNGWFKKKGIKLEVEGLLKNSLAYRYKFYDKKKLRWLEDN